LHWDIDEQFIKKGKEERRTSGYKLPVYIPAKKEK